ncbi:MAG: hypothetical protein WC150_10615 [Bacteroidia bacterium]
MTNPAESEGEEYIADYLRQVNIKFIQQCRITNLTGDTYQFRVADFYLPDYKVYIEFEGLYNNPEHKKNYQEKSKIYATNNIPCVYIFPENLGFIYFAFDKRIQKEMKKYNLTKELRRYHFKKLIMYHSERVIFIVFFALLALFYTDVNSLNQQTGIRLVGILGIVFQASKIITAYFDIFKLDKQPLVLKNT